MGRDRRMTSEVFEPHRCQLGEGPLWHPERNCLFWFDILGMRLHWHADGELRTVQFDEHVSAAGWVDAARLLVASESRLFLFDTNTEAQTDVAPLEADNPDNRSNDGRADPHGGFWIGTMAKDHAPRAGAIYRYYKGEVRQLYPEVTITNGMAFSPDGGIAYFADTAKKTVWKQKLDGDGWPDGDPEVYLDQTAEGLKPDGAVTDAEGRYWLAEWGAARVACYDASGKRVETVAFDALNTSCPAFGGPDLTDLYCTTAQEDLTDAQKNDGRQHGATFVAKGIAQGKPEPKVVL